MDPWVLLGADHGERPADLDRHTSEPVWIRGADNVEIEISGRTGVVEAILVQSPARHSDGVGTRRRELSGGAAEMPSIITRGEWGADESIRRSAPRYAPSLRFAVVHHTAGMNDYQPSEAASIVRGIYRYHVLGNGWRDIGYHFLIDRHGQIFEGRAGGIDRAVVGAHALGFNEGSVGVALMGDFAAATPTALQLAALEALLVWRLDIDHLDPAAAISTASSGNPEYAVGSIVQLPTICGHRQTGHTECPGDAFFPMLGVVQVAVASAPTLRIYDPLAYLGENKQGPVRFAARLSGAASWRVRILDPLGAVVWEVGGTGPAIDVRWDGLTASGAPALPASLLSWRIDAGATLSEARPATGRLVDAAVENSAASSVGADPLVLVPRDDGSLASGGVRWHQDVDALVTASVVDAAGRAVVTLASQTSYAAGDHILPWAGTDASGAEVASGHYAYAITLAPAEALALQLSYPVDVRRAAAGLTASPLVSPNGDGRRDQAVIRFARLEAGPIEVRVLRGARRMGSVAEAIDDAPGVITLRWKPRDLGDGSYVVQLLATTPGGLLELRAPLRIVSRVPTLSLRGTRRTPSHIYVLVNASTALFWFARTGGRRIARGHIPAGHHSIRLDRGALRGRHRLTILASDEAGTRARPLPVRFAEVDREPGA